MFRKIKDQTLIVASAIGLGLLLTISLAVPAEYIAVAVRLFIGGTTVAFLYHHWGEHLKHLKPLFHKLTGGKYVRQGTERPATSPTVGSDASDQGGSARGRSPTQDEENQAVA